jgi:hypothetical protein
MSDLLRTWAEAKIRAAIDRGDFNNLPGCGRPLKLRGSLPCSAGIANGL